MNTNYGIIMVYNVIANIKGNQINSDKNNCKMTIIGEKISIA